MAFLVPLPAAVLATPGGQGAGSATAGLPVILIAVVVLVVVALIFFVRRRR